MTLRGTALLHFALAVFAFVLPAGSAGALSGPPQSHIALDEAGWEVFEAIARRPAALRQAALHATLYPEVLAESRAIQRRSNAAFDARVESLDREDQQRLWELVRVPGVISTIVEEKARSRSKLEAIADRYPEASRAAIVHLGLEHHDLLLDAYTIKLSAERNFEQALDGLPDDARNAFHTLVDDPELAAMLAQSPDVVDEIGEAYRTDPDGTWDDLEALGEELAARDEELESEWSDGLAQDEDARREFDEAAERYADTYGWGDGDAGPDVRIRVDIGPYPYWYGYPSWYVGHVGYGHRWGVWWPGYLGFYYANRPRYRHGYRAAHVYWGLPSFYFASWLYDVYPDRYPHLARYVRRPHPRHHALRHSKRRHHFEHRSRAVYHREEGDHRDGRHWRARHRREGRHGHEGREHRRRDRYERRDGHAGERFHRRGGRHDMRDGHGGARDRDRHGTGHGERRDRSRFRDGRDRREGRDVRHVRAREDRERRRGDDRRERRARDPERLRREVVALRDARVEAERERQRAVRRVAAERRDARIERERERQRDVIRRRDARVRSERARQRGVRERRDRRHAPSVTGRSRGNAREHERVGHTRGGHRLHGAKAHGRRDARKRGSGGRNDRSRGRHHGDGRRG